MNTALKKDEKHINHQAKYMERHQTLCVTLDKEKDSDLISWLDKQENRSQAVRAALRERIINEKDNEPKDTVSDGDQETGSSEETDNFEVFEI